MINKSKAAAFLARTGVFFALLWFMSLDRNPAVVLAAKLGLSPSPLERLFGVKGMFSGMTEGMSRLVHGDIVGAVGANCLTPIFAAIFSVCLIGGYRPQLKTKAQEWMALLSVVCMSILINITNPL